MKKAFALFLSLSLIFALVTLSYAGDIEGLKAKAAKGDSGASYALALRYVRGEGVTKDIAEAKRWFLKGADQGHGGSQLALGMMYTLGKGVGKDISIAIQWFEKAARQGGVDAAFYLGAIYENEKGVTRDLVSSYKWTRLAAIEGHEGAKKLLAKIKPEMSKEEITRAELLSKGLVLK